MKHLQSAIHRLVLAVGLVCLTGTASAQISFGVSGSGNITFTAVPAVADWSTATIAGGGGDVATDAAMDADVQTRAASAYATGLGSSATTPPSANALARFNTTKNVVQTCPTGVKYTPLMATLRNDSGGAVASIQIRYDLGVSNALGTTTAEEIAGHRVYYSLSGAAGSWVVIPGLSSVGSPDSGVPVTLSADVTLEGGMWLSGSLLYILWVDDNGSADRSNSGTEEGAYTLNNVQFNLLVACTTPIGQNAPIVGLPADVGGVVYPLEHQPFSLTVEATGCISGYQWYYQDLLGNPAVALPGATGRTYTNASAALSPADSSGVYWVEMSGPANVGVVPSQTVTVQVQADVAAPRLLGAIAEPTRDTVIATFSEPMDEGLMKDPANFSISDGVNPAVDIVQIASDATGTIWSFELFPALLADTDFTFTVSGVTDTAATPNAIDPNPTTMGIIAQAVLLTPDDTHEWKYQSSFVREDGTGWQNPGFDDSRWTNGLAMFTQAPGPGETNLTWGSRTFLPSPDFSGITTYYRTRFTIPSATNGLRVLLRHAIDDGAVIYLNGQEVTRVRMPAGAFDWRTLATTAPEPTADDHAIEGPLELDLTHALVGENLLAVEVHQSAVDSSDLLLGLELTAEVAHFAAGPVVITRQPQGGTVNETQPFTFSVIAEGQLPMTYRWYHNDSPIANATNSTYYIGQVARTQAGDYRVEVTNPHGTVPSATTQLQVIEDLTPPTVVAAHGSYLLNQVTVSFSERMKSDPGSGHPDTANFTIDNGAAFSVISAVVDFTGTNIVLTLDNPLMAGGTYSLTVDPTQDLAGNPSEPITVPLLAFIVSRGFVLEQLYFNIGSGTSIADLTGNAKYPNSPDQVGYKSILEGPTDAYDRYGTRLSGWIGTPFDGEHVFYFCSDGAGQFSLSPNESPANLVLAAREITQSLARTWTGPGFNADRGDPPSNVSTQMLASGRLYAFEALAKEGTGTDNCGVNWKLPSGNVPVNGSPGIPGAFLYTLADPVGASVIITQQPVNVVISYRPPSPPQTVLDENFDDGNGGFTVINYGVPPGPWNYNQAHGTWTNFGPISSVCTGPYASGLNAPVLVFPNGGSATLTFTHRYSFEGLKPGDTTAWDGGQVRVSLNGGPLATLPATNFSVNGYIQNIGGNVTALLTNTPGWSYKSFVGESPGYAAPQYITSVATLGTFNPGDSIQIQFVTSWDDCAEGSEPNWEIDAVQVQVQAPDLNSASFTVGAESTYLWQDNTNLVYVWQRNNGAGFRDILGAYASTYTLNVGAADNGARFRCIVYGPAASAISGEASISMGLLLSATREGSNVRISWPLNDLNLVLETAPTVPSATWSLVDPVTYRSDANSNYVILPASADGAFFRLWKN